MAFDLRILDIYTYSGGDRLFWYIKLSSLRSGVCMVGAAAG